MRLRFAFACALLLAASLAAGTRSLADVSKPQPLETAQRQFDAGKYSDAVRTLEVALAAAPQDARLHHWLARCFYELRDVDRAVMAAERAVQLDPQNSAYHLWLGRAYGRRAERDRSFTLARKSKREFEEAVRLDPSSTAARRDLLEYLAEAPWIVGGSDDKARQQADAIARLDPVEGHLAWAKYWNEDHKPVRAEAEYRHILELKPSRVDPYFEVADFWEWRGDAARMEEAVEAAARVDSADLRLAYYRGAARVLAGNQFAEAERLLKSYLAGVPLRSDRPAHSRARVMLGALYERQGRGAEALEQYREVLRLDPKNKAAREALERLQKQK